MRNTRVLVGYTACLGAGLVGHWLTCAARAGMDLLDRR